MTATLKQVTSLYWRTWIIFLAPLLLSPIVIVYNNSENKEGIRCGYLILVMAALWITEALPLPITSMLPMVALPLLGIMSTGEVAINYLNATNYMFLGGLIMAIAVEHSGLHQRIALRIIMMVGTSQARLMLGFMFTTMFLSMWISNTATTAMMLPIVDAVAEAINKKDDPEDQAPLASLDVLSDSTPGSEGCDLDDLDDDLDLDLLPPQKVENPTTQASAAETNVPPSLKATVTSLASLTPGNDPDYMLAYLPNVRRNSFRKGADGTADPRDKLRRRNTVDKMVGVRKDTKQGNDVVPVAPGEKIPGTRFEKVTAGASYSCGLESIDEKVPLRSKLKNNLSSPFQNGTPASNGGLSNEANHKADLGIHRQYSLQETIPLLPNSPTAPSTTANNNTEASSPASTITAAPSTTGASPGKQLTREKIPGTRFEKVLARQPHVSEPITGGPDCDANTTPKRYDGEAVEKVKDDPEAQAENGDVQEHAAKDQTWEPTNLFKRGISTAEDDPDQNSRPVEFVSPKELHAYGHGQLLKKMSSKDLTSANGHPPIEQKSVSDLEDDLSIAYSANIGGTGVITGTPPNMVLPEVMEKSFGLSTGLTFATWMAFAIPAMLMNTILTWLWLQRLQGWYPHGKNLNRTKEQESRAMKVIKENYKNLGRMSAHELQVFILFVLLILLWFFKTPLFMPGWGDIFQVKTARGTTISVGSATPAIAVCLLLFILPQTYEFWPFAPMNRLITWRLIETKMCWGVIFLLGGGFALAAASQKSGLSSILVAALNSLNLSVLPSWMMVSAIVLITVAITNIASNTATANVLVPILSEMAVTMCIHPIYFTLPSAIACSYAFALPVATAPNAIVFGHSSMKTVDMMKAGVVVNLICSMIILLGINSYGIPIFDLNSFPLWARPEDNPMMCGNSTLF